MNNFYYKKDENNNVISVLESLPSKNTNQTEEEYQQELSSYNELNINRYSAIWDEAKRCPFDRDGIARYSLYRNNIVSNDNVLNIDVPETHTIDIDGVISWNL